MKIDFVTPRSSFLADCAAGIAAERGTLNAGGVALIFLKKGGYSRSMNISLTPDDQAAFEATYQSKDPSRFPVRIRAAATAIRDAGLYGHFHITHKDGELRIQRRGKSAECVTPRHA